MKPTRILMMTSLVGVVALAGCTDVNTPTADPNQRTKEGAVAGALTGVIAGLATSKDEGKGARRKSAIIGGIAGGVIGGAIGASLDKQAAELQASISDDRIQIINQGNQLVVRMPNDILFAFDSDQVSSGLRRDLRALANNLQRYPNSTVQITGHTDDIGTRAYNRDLSLRRANSVASILMSNGVSGNRIRTFGAGFDQPIASNRTPDGRALNRRVDIVIIPN